MLHHCVVNCILPSAKCTTIIISMNSLLVNIKESVTDEDNATSCIVETGSLPTSCIRKAGIISRHPALAKQVISGHPALG